MIKSEEKKKRIIILNCVEMDFDIRIDVELRVNCGRELASVLRRRFQECPIQLIMCYNDMIIVFREFRFV